MRYFLVILFGCFSIQMMAQEAHFIYIQTENRQPFYVRMEDKILSSTDYGYLIIPEIKSKEIPFVLGFPKNKWSSAKYTVNLSEGDRGYQLKQIDSSIWALYDLQDGSLLESAERYTLRKNNPVGVQDAFTEILSQVSNTPALVQTASITDTIATPKTALNVSNGKHSKNRDNEKAVEANQNNQQPPATIKQVMSASDNAGFSSVYHIADNGSNDTIVIFIPQEQSNKSAENVNIQKGLTSDSAQSIIVDANKQRIVSPADTLLGCKTIATEKEFFQWRKSMVLQDSEDLMLETFQLSIQQYCCTTEQVRNLSVLFLTETNRLKFLGVAYSHVSDKDYFPSLRNIFSNQETQLEFDRMFH